MNRPYPPAILRKKLNERAQDFVGKPVTQKQRSLAAVLIEQAFAGDGAELKRHASLQYLFDTPSLNDVPEVLVLVMLNVWLKPKQDSGGAYAIDSMAERELRLVYDEALRAQGQTEMEL